MAIVLTDSDSHVYAEAVQFSHGQSSYMDDISNGHNPASSDVTVCVYDGIGIR